MTSFREQGIARATAFLDLAYAAKTRDRLELIRRVEFISLDLDARSLDATDEELGQWLHGYIDAMNLVAKPAMGVA